ncbi:MAG: hypothetical protein DWQ18_04645 [Crenarchaeota archaeon]|nr:MAG: hypothetical protein DWQ17_08485 [Thermoproteota archaeon]RDJ34188.1 MAG: hypothetical protein DWQ18_04645 [Thermoproteota archaeon]RDJ36697.1 MAG: hypothetical protein DWQ13_05965 [Thermoproteota archaeon]RDJ37770.1 MAG: hypothetical protein DWQ19_04870 [Thermoproteota archaeon]
MRKIILKIKTMDYLDFLRASNESGKLTVEDMLYDLIQYYVIVERNKSKLFRIKQKKMTHFDD